MAAQEPVRKKTHKEWRKVVKKLRRKNIRQKLAEERNKLAAEEESARLKDPNYIQWLQNQEEFEALELEQEEHKRQEEEELWLRRELLARKKFREQQEKYKATAAIKEAERLRIQKEFEELEKKAQQRREERKQREEQAKRQHEEMLQKITEYIEVGGRIPEELKSNVQSNPNKQVCVFFAKANACRFGVLCLRNHIRPKLSRILFMPNFFTHIKLDHGGTDHGNDINLECSDNDLINDYKEFFNDVTKELRTYGEIDNFRTCMNTQSHLRGNVFVEYSTERDALRAYMKLQGRFYASRQINVEFSAITSWGSSICGLSFINKCPKGIRDCNYLHIFKNPGNLYNKPILRQEENKVAKNNSTRQTRDGSVMSWNDGTESRSRSNWRWSESPEGNATQIKRKSRSRKGSPKRKRKSKESSSAESHKNRSRARSRSRMKSRSRTKSQRRTKSRSKTNSRSRTKSRREERNSKEHWKRSSERSSSKSSHRKERSSKSEEKKKRNKSISPARSRRHHKDSNRENNKKDRKRKHKSKRKSS